jgi:hypothetical protein
MLDARADTNAVSEDEVVVTKIRAEHEWDEDIDETINYRRLEWYYDTPLKIVMKQIEGATPSTQELTTLTELKDLLKSYGGKPLHLFPIKDLPRYVKEDVELESGNKVE